MKRNVPFRIFCILIKLALAMKNKKGKVRMWGNEYCNQTNVLIICMYIESMHTFSEDLKKNFTQISLPVFDLLRTMLNMDAKRNIHSNFG